MMTMLQSIASQPDIANMTLIGLGVFAVLLLVLFSLDFLGGQDKQMRRRIDQVTVPNAATDEPLATTESVRRNTSDSKIASIDRLVKGLLPNVDRLRSRLERSGWPLKIGDYLLICAGLFLVSSVSLWLLLGFSWLINLLAGFTIGFGLPHFVVGRQIAKRAKKFSALLPEALDLIVRGVRSGLPVTETMKTIAEEIGDPVGPEFQNISDQMSIGVSMDEAMWTTAKRLEIAEFNFLVISMSIQKETGGNLAEILENLSNMIRRREQMRLKVKAMSSEARASAMIIGSLPFIMCAIISFINPKYMSTLFVDPRGWIMIAMGLTSLVIGLLVMAKMVRFEI
jgi:tight adherence protein B